MSRTWRIYYNVVFGGLGGLLAWLIVGGLPDVTTNDFVWELVVGLFAGLGIGALLGAVEGALGRRWGRMIVGLARGGGLGVVGGLLGLAVGEALFLLTQGGYVGRSIGWAIVGAVIGTTEGIATRAPRKTTYGFIGGALGGLIGGVLFEALTEAALNFSADPSTQAAVQSTAAAIGLVLVGALIGFFIALVERIVFPAYLRVVRGEQEGKDFPVVKPEMTIGRGDGNDIPLYDSSIGERFAILRQQGKQVLIENANGVVSVLRPGQARGEPVRVQKTLVLQDGDKLQVGNAQLRFHQRGGPRNA